MSGKTLCASGGMGAAPLLWFHESPRTAHRYAEELQIAHVITDRRVSDARCRKDQDSGHARAGGRALAALREVPVRLQFCASLWKRVMVCECGNTLDSPAPSITERWGQSGRGKRFRRKFRIQPYGLVPDRRAKRSGSWGIPEEIGNLPRSGKRSSSKTGDLRRPHR